MFSRRNDRQQKAEPRNFNDLSDRALQNQPEICPTTANSGLTSLDLSNSGLGNRRAGALAALPALQTLTVVNCDVDDEDIAVIAKLPNLRTFDASGNRIGATGLRSLSRALALETLHLSIDEIFNESDANALKELTCIKSLNIAPPSIKFWRAYLSTQA